MLPGTHASQRASELGETKSKQARVDRARKRSKERLEEALEEGLKETFPGSDPVAVIEPARERPGLRLDASPRAMLSPFHGQHAALSRVASRFRGWGKAAVGSLRIHLKPRWASACGAWFAALLAVVSGLSDWRVAVMVSATAFMLARAGDMLDDH
jgi:hypothetical protein